MATSEQIASTVPDNYEKVTITPCEFDVWYDTTKFKTNGFEKMEGFEQLQVGAEAYNIVLVSSSDNSADPKPMAEISCIESYVWETHHSDIEKDFSVMAEESGKTNDRDYKLFSDGSIANISTLFFGHVVGDFFHGIKDINNVGFEDGRWRYKISVYDIENIKNADLGFLVDYHGLSQSQASQIKSKTYTNEKYDLSFKYPSDLAVEELDLDDANASTVIRVYDPNYVPATEVTGQTVRDEMREVKITITKITDTAKKKINDGLSQQYKEPDGTIPSYLNASAALRGSNYTKTSGLIGPYFELNFYSPEYLFVMTATGAHSEIAERIAKTIAYFKTE